jgi:hypothetical protein
LDQETEKDRVKKEPDLVVYTAVDEVALDELLKGIGLGKGDDNGL